MKEGSRNKPLAYGHNEHYRDDSEYDRDMSVNTVGTHYSSLPTGRRRSYKADAKFSLAERHKGIKLTTARKVDRTSQ